MKRATYQLKLPARTLVLGERTLVMGILNVTPDSFSDGGEYYSYDNAIERALAIEAEGADILDIGAESSRPNAQPVSLNEELARLLPILEGLKGKLKIPISVDTYKAPVAQAAIAAGAELINDISALRLDSQMADVVAQTGAAICLMHMRGTPQVMQKLPPSTNIWAEIDQLLSQAVTACQAVGIDRDRLIIDPGIGFGKTVEDNLAIIAQLRHLESFDLPILIGTSRKSFIGHLIGRPEQDRLLGTVATVTASILNGAHIVRVHDVAANVDIARITDAILKKADEP